VVVAGDTVDTGDPLGTGNAAGVGPATAVAVKHTTKARALRMCWYRVIENGLGYRAIEDAHASVTVFVLSRSRCRDQNIIRSE
jgi:hypothetical protein